LTPQRDVVHNNVFFSRDRNHNVQNSDHRVSQSLATSDDFFIGINSTQHLVASPTEAVDNSCNNSLYDYDLRASSCNTVLDDNISVTSCNTVLDDNRSVTSCNTVLDDNRSVILTDDNLTDALLLLDRCSLTPTALFDDAPISLPGKTYNNGGHSLLACQQKMSRKSETRLNREKRFQLEIIKSLSYIEGARVLSSVYGKPIDMIILVDFCNTQLVDEYADRTGIDVSGINNDCFYQSIIVSLFVTSYFAKLVKESLNLCITNFVTPAKLRKLVADTLISKSNTMTECGCSNLELFRMHETRIIQLFSVSVDLEFQFQVSFALLLNNLVDFSIENEKYLRCYYSKLLAKVNALYATENIKINNMNGIDNLNNESKLKKLINSLLADEFTNSDHTEKMSEGLNCFKFNFEKRLCSPDTSTTIDQLYVGSHSIYKARLTSFYKVCLENIASDHKSTFNDEISILQTAELINVELVIHEKDKQMIFINQNPKEIKHKIHLYKQGNHWSTDIDQRDIDQNWLYDGGTDDVLCLNKLKLVRNIPFIAEQQENAGLSHDNIVRNDLLNRTFRKEHANAKRLKIC
jgi:hypothetical protein